MILLVKAKLLPVNTETHRKNGIWVKIAPRKWRRVVAFYTGKSWPYPYSKPEIVGSGSVQIHPEHGRRERLENYEAAKAIAELGYNVKLLPVIKDVISDDNKIIEGVKSPDFFVQGNGELAGMTWELEGINSKNINSLNIKRTLESGSKQAQAVLIGVKQEIRGSDFSEGVKRFRGWERKEGKTPIKKIALYYNGKIYELSSNSGNSIVKVLK